MHIEHVAIWTTNLERLKSFYQTWFEGQAGPKYTNPVRKYQSYFISFVGGARLELMQMPSIPLSLNQPETQATGLIHLALSVGSPAAVDDLTGRLRQAGCPVVSEPRWTGDGYYESCILDLDGNRIEITG